MTNTEAALTRMDLLRVQDFLAVTQERIETVEVPSSTELVQRRLAIQRVKQQVRALLGSHELCSDAEADWQALDPIISKLMLENFTRQVGDDEGVSVVLRDATKDHHYLATSNRLERRTYAGLHRMPYDDLGLSVVTAYKPTLHQQPFHTHHISGENSLAIHPTNGYAFLPNRPSAHLIAADAGQMFTFGPYTPHTLQNPTLSASVDVSVKVPEALNDRAPFSPQSLSEYLLSNAHLDMNARFRSPYAVREGDGYKETIYCIEDCGRKYFVHYTELAPGKEYEVSRVQDMKPGSVEILQGFAVLGELEIDLEIFDGAKKSKLTFGDYGVVPEKTSTYMLKNLDTSPISVYRAYEVDSRISID